MNQEQEDELLLHVATGTDLLTAIAALPRQNESPGESASTPDRIFSAIAWIVLAGVGIVVLLLLL